jgi:hypothetical protein
MLIADLNWSEKRAAEVRQRAIARRRRHRLDREVIGRFTGIDAAPRERLAAVPPGQLADLGVAAPVTPPAAITPIDRASDAARLHQYQHDVLQRAARAADEPHNVPAGLVDFRGSGIDSD